MERFSWNRNTLLKRGTMTLTYHILSTNRRCLQLHTMSLIIKIIGMLLKNTNTTKIKWL